jgi:transposase
MLPAMSRHQIEQMRAQGLSQREISKRTGIPRSTLQRLLKAPYIPEVVSEGLPQVVKSQPLPQSLVEAGPVLLEMAAW